MMRVEIYKFPLKGICYTARFSITLKHTSFTPNSKSSTSLKKEKKKENEEDQISYVILTVNVYLVMSEKVSFLSCILYKR